MSLRNPRNRIKRLEKGAESKDENLCPMYPMS